MSKYHKIVEEKGGHILKNRTTVRGVCIGDIFCYQQDTGNQFTVYAFFKDKVFNKTPMVLGVNNSGNGTILCSIGFVNVMKKKENKHAKCKRRK
jgi:hypothetical protein